MRILCLELMLFHQTDAFIIVSNDSSENEAIKTPLMTENRSALLPDRLKRKPNVRKREQNENNAPLPWRPAGNNNKASSSKQAETCCQGVHPLQRQVLEGMCLQQHL